MNNFNIPQATADELSQKLSRGDDFKLIDVRNPDEYAAGHISNAQNVPLNSIDQYQGNHQEDLYVICQSGKRSQKGAKQLAEKGYHVTNVTGGMNLWRGKTVK